MHHSQPVEEYNIGADSDSASVRKLRGADSTSPRPRMSADPADSSSSTRSRSSSDAHSPTEKSGMVGPPTKPLLIALFMNGVLLSVLFWILTSLINGKMYGKDQYSDRLHVLAVNMDGSDIGDVLLQTTGSLNSIPGQPTWRSTFFTSAPTYLDIYDRVRSSSDIWGAIIANPNATANLLEAITNTSSSAAPYDPQQAITIIYNSARYSSVELELQGKMVAAVAKLQVEFQAFKGLQNIQLLQPNGTAANKLAVLQPIGYTVDNIKEFTHSTSFLSNTVMIVFPILSQFFMVLGINGILNEANAYKLWSFKKHIMIRLILSILYPLVIGLSWAAWIFIWRGATELSGTQYILSGLVTWLFCMINFHVVDGVFAHGLAMRWTPFFVFTWIVMQVTATISPIQLANQFYRYEYVLPSHHCWDVLMTIFGEGATDNLKLNLPMLSVWFLVSVVWNFMGNLRRWRMFQKMDMYEAH